jgi:large subunit ribosomal protein L9
MMKIILREDVSNLGKAGEIATVRPGYGRNFLIPYGKAVLASDKNVREMEHQKRVIFQQQAKIKASAEAVAQKLAGMQITISRKVGEQEKLYGSVSNKDIADAIAKMGLQIDRHTIQLPDAIRELGTFDVPVKLHQSITASVKVWVVKE